MSNEHQDKTLTALENLVKENEQLKNQLAQNSSGVQALLAQLDAHKIHYNEAVTNALNLRTSLLLAQRQNKELNEAVERLSKRVEQLEAI